MPAAQPDHGQLLVAITRVDTTLGALEKRIDRLDDSRHEHLSGIYKRLGRLEAGQNVTVGRRAIWTGAWTLVAGMIGAAVSWLLRGGVAQ